MVEQPVVMQLTSVLPAVGVTAHSYTTFFHTQPSLGLCMGTQQGALVDLLVQPALVKHGVVEVNGLSVAAVLHIVTHCFDAQLQVPLGVLHHGAAGLGVCVDNLHAKKKAPSQTSLCVRFSQHLWTATRPYSSRVALVWPESVLENPATAPSSCDRPSQPLGQEAVGTPPGRSCT